jgi:4-amino-4-deoxy-L-arabinose transferase-like glycosyltransferase
VRRALVILVPTLTLAAAVVVLAGRPDDPRARLRWNGVQYTGSWWFPRGGPYILGFDAPAGATELAIDGQPAVSGSGRVSKRILYPAGAHAVRLSGPGAPGARLLWHPPGRRGALEYVPASSLSSDPPLQARFESPGASPAQAHAATAALLVLAAGFLLLVRPFRDSRAAGIGLAIFAVALAVRVWRLGDAGQTWDEDEYWTSGRNYLVNLMAGDFADRDWLWNYQHPPLTKYLAGVGALWADGFAPARLIFAILGAGTCVLVYAVGRRCFGGRGVRRGSGERAAILAALTCAFLPHLVAHARIIGHETPSAFLWTLAVWLALGVRDPDEHSPIPELSTVLVRLVGVGAAVGLAVAVRFPNLLLLPVVGVAVAVVAGRSFRTTLLAAAVIPLAGAAVFVLVWPRMWHAPVAHLHAAWNILKQPHLPEVYLGHRGVLFPPWHYFPVYALVTTPVAVLALAALGLVRAARERDGVWLVILVWMIAPFGVAFSPVRQDGVRYLLQLLPALALAAGAGLDQLLSWVRAPRVVAAGAGLGYVAYLAVTLLRVEPYPLDYYAEPVGGPAEVAARERFEIGWWGEGIADAVSWLNLHAAPGAHVARLVYPNHVTWFSYDVWPHVSDGFEPDTEWILTNDMWLENNLGFQLPEGATLVHDVKAQGASLVRVYHLPRH